VVRIIHRD